MFFLNHQGYIKFIIDVFPLCVNEWKTEANATQYFAIVLLLQNVKREVIYFRFDIKVLCGARGVRFGWERESESMAAVVS